jgi:hypothetical protein
LFQFKGVLVKSISLFLDEEEIKIAAGEPITVDPNEMLAEYRGHCFEPLPEDYKIVN